MQRIMVVFIFVELYIIEFTSNLIYTYKRVRPTKNEPQQHGISYLVRQREGVIKSGAGGWFSRHAYLRLG
jgi:hypothetical protein